MRSHSFNRIAKYANYFCLWSEGRNAFTCLGRGKIGGRDLAHLKTFVIAGELAPVPCSASMKIAVKKTSFFGLGQTRLALQDLVKPTGPGPRRSNDKKTR